MRRRPPRPTQTGPLFPYPPRFRSGGDADPPQHCGARGRDRVMEAAFDAVAAGAQEIRLTVNGKTVALVVDPRERLSEALLHELGLPGTKVGCSASDCGACPVLVDGAQLCACQLPCGPRAAPRARTSDVWGTRGA